MIPGPWEGIVLALAAWRAWRLLAEDDLPVLNAMHVWIRGRNTAYEDGRLREGDARNHRTIAKWLDCPFCSGAWIALAFYGFWLWQPRWTLCVAFGFALSAAVGLIASRLDSD